jgi:hypothetical protein
MKILLIFIQLIILIELALSFKDDFIIEDVEDSELEHERDGDRDYTKYDDPFKGSTSTKGKNHKSEAEIERERKDREKRRRKTQEKREKAERDKQKQKPKDKKKDKKPKKEKTDNKQQKHQQEQKQQQQQRSSGNEMENKLKACGKMAETQIQKDSQLIQKVCVEKYEERNVVERKVFGIIMEKCVIEIEPSMAEYYVLGYLHLEGMQYTSVDYDELQKLGFDFQLSLEEEKYVKALIKFDRSFKKYK